MTEQGGEALYQVAVRALCEFSAKRGDLDLRFTPSPSALEGIAGHTLVTSRRPAHYQREVALDGRYRHLQVRGRADGYDPQANCLEEIKTHRGDLALQPANHRHLHWAQARVYGWLLCAERKLEEVELALVYLEVGSQKETRFVERVRADELRLFFESQCQAFLAWAEQELAHRQRRDRELAALRFPHAEFRHGQRQLAEAVYKAASAGCCLMAQAPTGIGKTIGTLFPQLKAMPGQRLDRLFFLAAKTPGRALALHALRSLEGETGGLPVRVLELVARDKACEHPDKACHGESCPLAQGACRRPAPPPWRRAGWTRRGCARWRWRTGSVPTTWARNWRAGATWRWATTTTTSILAPCSMAWPRSTSGGWRYWWTRRTTWWSAAGGCIPPNSTRAISSVCAKPPRRP